MMFMLPLAVLALIVLSATLAASETALFSMARLEHTREQMSLSVQHALDRLMRRPLESLIVIIGLNEACNIFADCLATIILLAWLGDKWGPIVAAPAVLAEFVHPFARHFTPLEQAPTPGPVSEAEFKTLLRLGENQGQVEPAERAMIHRVFDFGARRASEVMTPRERI